MTSDKDQISNVKLDIQNTLMSINQLTLKIKDELDTIIDLVKESGHLHTAVIHANQKLTAVSQNMGIDVEDVLSNKEEENKVLFNLRNVLSAADFQEKVIASLKNP